MHLGAQRLGTPTETRARSREYDLPTTQHSVHKTKLVGIISNLFTKLKTNKVQHQSFLSNWISNLFNKLKAHQLDEPLAVLTPWNSNLVIKLEFQLGDQVGM